MAEEARSTPALTRALKKIEEKGLTIKDLPLDPNAEDWKAVERETKLQLVELLALKAHRLAEEKKGRKLFSRIRLFFKRFKKRNS